jgi:hypothetical protein
MQNSRRQWLTARRLSGLLVVALAMLSACGEDQRNVASAAYPHDDTLRLNQIQVVGSHNSYHIQPRPELLQVLLRFGTLAQGIEYTHPPLDQQFETQGVRQIEIDVWADPAGGLFANRAGLAVAHEPTASGIPELSQPGFKVLHIQDIDFESTCWTFVECLQTVKSWSDAHPGHVPIMILIEAKDDPLPIPLAGVAVPVPIGTVEFDALDAEIRSVLPPGKIITPDEVRGQHATLEAAILTDGWPTLRRSRGRVLFTLDNAAKRDAYIAGHPSLTGRILFTNAEPGDPDAAFVEINDAAPDYDKIQQTVRAGYIVRTRADADTVEARANDTTVRDAAISSGAQFVSTDYPVPDPAIGNDYQVTMPMGMPARCNPISAPVSCTSLDIENPAHLLSR